jgi:hypothetical protein
MILFIVSRVLLVASLVFILGYVFGNFSRNRTLTRITKVASILLVVMFIGMNIAFARFAARNGMRQPAAWGCEYQKADSTINKY